MRPIPPPQLMDALWAWIDKEVRKERERCAQVAEETATDTETNPESILGMRSRRIAAAIRAKDDRADAVIDKIVDRALKDKP